MWLSRRQTDLGGFNGRPEKLPDVCYSWWILSSMHIIKRDHLVDQEALKGFILRSQDPDEGGIGDRPGNESDIFHTFFGIASLSLIDKSCKYGLKKIDPTFAIPVETINSKLPHLTKYLS